MDHAYRMVRFFVFKEIGLRDSEITNADSLQQKKSVSK